MGHLVQAEQILTRLGVVAIDEPVNMTLTRSPITADVPVQPSAGTADTVAS
jgi:hypothetical protein